jgi:hypothetical protein
MIKVSLLFLGVGFLGNAVAQDVTFDFDSGPLSGSMPFYQTAGGITAHFTATGNGFSIQRADVLGFTPAGFSGFCIYPNSVYLADLLISFDTPLKGISILYAPEEYATDSSCTMLISAYLGSTLVGTNLHTIDPPGTWPSGTLSFTTTQKFDNVVIHYFKPPATGGDYGPIFMADNLVVTLQHRRRQPCNFPWRQIKSSSRGRPTQLAFLSSQTQTSQTAAAGFP